jgi:hypothetical protein
LELNLEGISDFLSAFQLGVGQKVNTGMFGSLQGVGIRNIPGVVGERIISNERRDFCQKHFNPHIGQIQGRLEPCGAST